MKSEKLKIKKEQSRAIEPLTRTRALLFFFTFSFLIFNSAVGAAESRWIWTSNAAEPGNEPQFVRISFDLPDDPGRATYTVTCDNGYTAFVNGKQVGAGTEWAT